MYIYKLCIIIEKNAQENNISIYVQCISTMNVHVYVHIVLIYSICIQRYVHVDHSKKEIHVCYISNSLKNIHLNGTHHMHDVTII